MSAADAYLSLANDLLIALGSCLPALEQCAAREAKQKPMPGSILRPATHKFRLEHIRKVIAHAEASLDEAARAEQARLKREG